MTVIYAMVNVTDEYVNCCYMLYDSIIRTTTTQYSEKWYKSFNAMNCKNE